MLIDERSMTLFIDDDLSDTDAAHAVAVFDALLRSTAEALAREMAIVLGRFDIRIEVDGWVD